MFWKKYFQHKAFVLAFFIDYLKQNTGQSAHRLFGSLRKHHQVTKRQCVGYLYFEYFHIKLFNYWIWLFETMVVVGLLCGKRAKVNCVRCMTCKKWIQARCVRVKRVSRRMNENFEFRVCMNGANLECKNASNGCLGELETVNSFCYLGYNVIGGGGSELAVTRRFGLGWKLFNSVSSMLCGKRHTWNIKGQIYRTCVRPVMTYGSETWVVRSVEKSILRRAEKRMLKMMCGVQPADDVCTKELMVRLGLDCTIVELVRQGSLRWLGHVVRKEDDDCVKQAWRFEVEGRRAMGRPRLTWKGIMENLCRGLGLVLEDGYDGVKWREG